MDEIIRKHREAGSSDNKRSESSDLKSNGWSMNNSPFRDRKGGLNWGGGNIHAAEASRKSRRSFLR